jgi:hypothetical protein
MAWAAERLVAPRVSVQPEVRLPALIELADLIWTALPALPESIPASLGCIPKALETRRASVLLQRAEQMGSSRFELAPTALPEEVSGDSLKTTPKPQDIIRSINAVLKDFTPEALQTMAPEKLHGVASLILEQMQETRHGHADNLLGLQTLSLASSERILTLQGGNINETLMNPGHNEMHSDDIIVHGVPESVRPLPAGRNNKLVLRHFTTREALPKILASKRIWNGIVRYIQVSPGTFHKTFKDLTGTFFTLPGVDGEDVGVPPRGGYKFFVDVLIPAALPVLEIEPGRIFLLPFPARPRAWILDYYLKWIKGEMLSRMDQRTARNLDEDGGPGPSLDIPVTIVEHGHL